MASQQLPYEMELIEQAMTTPLSDEVVSGDCNFDFLKIVCKVDEEDVETSAFGLIYTLSCLSFRDARPAGASEIDFEDQDAWTASDLLRCLRFENGQLSFDADYERGRRMKTTIRLTREGTLTLETSGRGTSATRWISMIQGKNVLTVIRGEKR